MILQPPESQTLMRAFAAGSSMDGKMDGFFFGISLGTTLELEKYRHFSLIPPELRYDQAQKQLPYGDASDLRNYERASWRGEQGPTATNSFGLTLAQMMSPRVPVSGAGADTASTIQQGRDSASVIRDSNMGGICEYQADRSPTGGASYIQLIHEYGHMIDFDWKVRKEGAQATAQISNETAFVNMYNTVHAGLPAGNTVYAATARAEWFPECFASYVCRSMAGMAWSNTPRASAGTIGSIDTTNDTVAAVIALFKSRLPYSGMDGAWSTNWPPDNASGVVTPTTDYSQDFESFANNTTNPDSWTAHAGGQVATAKSTTGSSTGHSGTSKLRLTQSDTSTMDGHRRTLTGLTVGVLYTFSAWVIDPNSESGVTCQVGATGFGASTAITVPTSWTQISYSFTATATSHELILNMANTVGGAFILWDDITVTH